ncbi:MAG TPA: helix-hairpin-helix domain-containing protein [Candidatus Evtepia faecigallinarum]|nr:helix-hairpin-helix domain-containing protein [Candidatus Evtepia faecigallinarum]
MKISRLELLTLLLTALFAAGTLLWFFAAPPRQGVTVSTVRDLPAAEETEPAAPGLLDGEVMDLNTASAADLTRLPGIGQVKAEAIVAWREEHGGFSSVEELLEVKGIGEATLEGLRPYVTAAPAAEEGGDHGTNPGGG